MVARVQVPLTGSLCWKLVFDYDNSHNSGTIRRTYRHKTIHKFSRSMFVEKTHESARQKDLNSGGAYSIISASIDHGYEASTQISHIFSSTTSSQTDISSEIQSEFEQEYLIGPNSKLSLYQLYFDGPGITYACDTYSTSKKPMEDVKITVQMEEIDFVSDIKVIYGSSKFDNPDNGIKEINGNDADINFGFGGGYVYLVPEWTKKVDKACTGFDVIVSQDNEPSYSALARGDGGQFRYLKPVKDPRNKNKVTDVGLLRKASKGSVDDVCSEFNKITGDINEKRGGGFLHLVYKIVPAQAL